MLSQNKSQLHVRNMLKSMILATPLPLVGLYASMKVAIDRRSCICHYYMCRRSDQITNDDDDDDDDDDTGVRRAS